MKKEKKPFMSRLKQFGFAITYQNSSSLELQDLIWLCEKSLILSPAVIYIFHGTPWQTLSDFFQTIMTSYIFTTSSVLTEFVCILFSIYQILALLTLYVLLYEDLSAAVNSRNVLSSKSFLVPILGYFFMVIHRICLQPVVLAFSYLLLLFLNDAPTFPEYKEIASDSFEARSGQHVLLFVFATVCLLENLIVSLCSLFFFKDCSLVKVSAWSSNLWQTPLLELLAKIFIPTVFILDMNDSAITPTSFVASLVFITLVALRFYKTLSAYFWADLAELFYECLGFLLYAFILIGQLMQEARQNYQDTATFIPLIMLICAHRGIRMEVLSHRKPKTDSEAVYLIHKLISLCSTKGTCVCLTVLEHDASVKLASLLTKHASRCGMPYECECKKLLHEIPQSIDEPIQISLRAYTSLQNLPETITNRWKLRVLNALVGDIAKKFGRCDDIMLLVAQIYYLYLGNHYYSLVLISNIECKNPPLLIKLQLYYLRSMISAGMLGESENSLKLLDSLEYQRHYKKFLRVADGIADLTVKFWASLLQEIPDTHILNTIGINLFKLRKRFMGIVKEINKICANNVEFLVKYGLYMKVIIHDSYTASTSFNNIVRSMDRIRQRSTDDQTFSILRSDIRNMMIVISLESKDFMNITDANSEAERLLKCTRKELIGKSAANIMPPMIGQAHQKYMQRYFKTMVTTNINTKKLKWIKNRDGMYVACSVMKNIVPRLAGGFKGVMFAHVDKKISCYTNTKKHTTYKKIGAIICDDNLKILGFSAEVAELLFVPENVLSETTNKTSLESLFPEVATEKGIEVLKESGGGVLEFRGRSILSEGEIDDTIPGSKTAAGILMWARIVKESYGDETTAFIFLFSPIASAYVPKYVQTPETGFYRSSTRNSFKKVAVYRPEEYKKESSTPYAAENEARMTGELDEINSVSNSGSQSNSAKTGSSGQSNQLAKELLDRALSNETPGSIKKLAAAIIGLFFVVITLIVVDAILTVRESNSLQNYLTIVQAYESRYKHTLIIYNQAMLYNGSRSGERQMSYEMATLRMADSLQSMTRYNVQLRKDLAKLNLDYDTYDIEVMENSQPLTISFSHSILKVINYCVNLLKVAPYSALVELSKRTTSREYQDNVVAVNYVVSSTLAPMRIYQDKYSKELRNKIFTMTDNGEDTLYILIGSCIAVVFVSIGLTLPIFIWVIKDKSYVIAIFADITDQEIKSIIESAAGFDIRRIKYKKKWILNNTGEEEKFWSRVLRDQKKRQGGKNSHDNEKEKLDNDVQRVRMSELRSIMGSEHPLTKTLNGGPSPSVNNQPPKADDNEEEKSPQPEDQSQAKSVALSLDDEQSRKSTVKRGILSRLDTKLRNTAIFRLAIVLFVFLIYSGVSLYFNYYIHNFSRITISHFYVLLRRSLNIPIITTMLRMAVTTGDLTYIKKNESKFLLICNKKIGNDGIEYGYEAIQSMLDVETKIKEYEKIGNRNIFKEYFETTRKLDTDQFCPLVDAMPDPQPAKCGDLYIGPQSQGLSGGFAYLTSFCDTFGMRILRTDFNNETQVEELRTDKNFLDFPFTINQYFFPPTKLVAKIYKEEATNFFTLIEQLAISKSASFGFIFAVVYFFVFINFLETLKLEIWQTHGIINMIPDKILDSNKAVQEQVWKRRGIK